MKFTMKAKKQAMRLFILVTDLMMDPTIDVLQKTCLLLHVQVVSNSSFIYRLLGIVYVDKQKKHTSHDTTCLGRSN